MSINSMALKPSGQGKYAEAEQMHRETLALRDRVLGKEHPDTLTSMNNLANTLSSQGKYAEAEQMHQETLVLREKVLGKEHPNTLESVYWLAYLLQLQHRYWVTLSLYERACTGYQITLGPDHPTTREFLEQYTSVQQLVDEQTSRHGRHGFTEAISDPKLSDPHDSNTAELALRPKNRLLRN